MAHGKVQPKVRSARSVCERTVQAWRLPAEPHIGGTRLAVGAAWGHRGGMVTGLGNGFMAVAVDIDALKNELEHLSPALQERLSKGAFDRERLLGWAAEVGGDKDVKNRLSAVTAPLPEDIAALPAPGSAEHERLVAVGEAALRRGEVALLVLAGGMATRMGGVVKALVEALPGKTFLQLRLGEKDALTARYGKPFPLWLMTSEATDGPIRAALGARLPAGEPGEAAGDLGVFPQNISLRLDTDGSLFHEESGEPSLYPTGHGDVPDALVRSGLLGAFLARGGKYVWIANLDNLGAAIDPALLGAHIEGGAPLSVEVVDKAGDKGGIPVRYEGRPIMCEDFRLPKGFDASQVKVFNTNTFLADAAALAGYQGSWTYCVVEKKVGERPAIQRERLLGELTFHLRTRFLWVPREGAGTRFLPVKDREELARRQADIEAVARARGMLGG
jgi:UTP--glucose-1-phosphate uridylyltransferase